MKYVAFALTLLIFLLLSYNLFSNVTVCHIQAPDFTLPDETGTFHTLSQLRGSKVALYFYPRDYTPGCTAQACSIRDNFDTLAHYGITIFGLSTDSKAQHQKFKNSYSLPFHLLIADKETLRAYGVDGLFFTKRRTFLIDENGVIIAIITDINTKNHAQQILEGFGIYSDEPHTNF